MSASLLRDRKYCKDLLARHKDILIFTKMIIVFFFLRKWCHQYNYVSVQEFYLKLAR